MFVLLSKKRERKREKERDMDFDKNFERNEERKEESNGGDEEALRGHIASGQGKDLNRSVLA